MKNTRRIIDVRLPPGKPTLHLPKSLLSKPAILREMQLGNIVIDPFDERSLGPNSYDVTLGQFFWREHDPTYGNESGLPKVYGTEQFYNPFDADHVKALWKKDQAQPAGDMLQLQFRKGLVKGIREDDLIIIIKPGERILAHTREFIGGRGKSITTKMFARSSVGRNSITVCGDAGLGDVGYFSRWTLELSSMSRFHSMPLVVGRRIAQLVFFEVEPVEESYDRYGKYQSSDDLEELKKNWRPELMLPRMYNDREVALKGEEG